VGQFLADDSRSGGETEHNEREFTALRRINRKSSGAALIKAVPEPHAIQYDGLHDQQANGQRQDEGKLALEQVQVERHAYGREEQAEQKPLKWRHISFDLVAVGGVGEKHAGNEGAESGR